MSQEQNIFINPVDIAFKLADTSIPQQKSEIIKEHLQNLVPSLFRGTTPAEYGELSRKLRATAINAARSMRPTGTGQSPMVGNRLFWVGWEHKERGIVNIAESKNSPRSTVSGDGSDLLAVIRTHQFLWQDADLINSPRFKGSLVAVERAIRPTDNKDFYQPTAVVHIVRKGLSASTQMAETIFRERTLYGQLKGFANSGVHIDVVEIPVGKPEKRARRSII